MPHRTPADTAAATQKTDKHTPVPRRTTGNRTEHTCPTQKKHCAHEKKSQQEEHHKRTLSKKQKKPDRKKNTASRKHRSEERRAKSDTPKTKKHHEKKIPHTLITRKNVLRKTLSCNIFVINNIKIYYDGRRITTTKNQNKQPNNPPAIKSAKTPHRSPLPAPRSPPTGKPSHP